MRSKLSTLKWLMSCNSKVPLPETYIHWFHIYLNIYMITSHTCDKYAYVYICGYLCSVIFLKCWHTVFDITFQRASSLLSLFWFIYYFILSFELYLMTVKYEKCSSPRHNLYNILLDNFFVNNGGYRFVSIFQVNFIILNTFAQLLLYGLAPLFF